MNRAAESSQPQRILMVGFAVPDELMDHLAQIDRFPAVQTHKLSWSLIRGLETQGDVTVDLLSSLPVSTYPHTSKIFAGCQFWDRGNGSRNVTLPFINLLLLKHLTRFLSCLAFTSRWLVATRRCPDRVVLLYGIHSAHLLAVLFVAKLFGVRLVALVTDPPNVSLPGEGWGTRKLRLVDRWLQTKALRCMDGLVVLTQQLADTFAPGVPALVMEGVLSSRDVAAFLPGPGIPEPTAREDDQSQPYIVLYAGLLLESYGLGLLLDAFSRLEGEHCRLWICGNGPLAEQVRQAAAEDSRITYWGFLSHPRTLELLRQATVLINPRPSRQDFTAFSFPSKTLEYLAAGKPVLSTRLPGIPDEYFACLQPIEDETPAGLAGALAAFRDLPSGERARLGALGRNFVLEQKSEARQGRRIGDFLRSLRTKSVPR